MNINEGFIDIWFILNDRGLMIEIGHLLGQHSVWRKCQIRVFGGKF